MTYNTGNPIGSADPRDLYDNAQNLDEAVNADADSFIDRLGKLRPTIKGAIDPTGLASSAAASAQQAESARDAAFVNADVYDSTAAGLSATTSGEQFQVLSGNEYVRYENDNGVAVEVARYPTAVLARSSIATLYVKSTTSFQIDTVAGTIEVADDGVRCTSSNKTLIVNQGVYNFPASNSVNLRLEVNPSNGDLEVKDSASGNVDVTNFVVGFIDVPLKRVHGLSVYTIDGVPVVNDGLSHIGLFYANDMVAFNTTDMTVSIPAHRVYVGGRNYLRDPEVLSLPSDAGRFIYNMRDDALIAIPTSTQLPKLCVELGAYNLNRDIVEISSNFSIDGISRLYSYPIKNRPPSYEATLVVLNASDVIFDGHSKQITFANNRVRIAFKNTTRLIPSQTVDTSGNTNIRWHLLVYNVANDTLFLNDVVSPETMSSDDYIVGKVYLYYDEFRVEGIDRYTVNGRAYEKSHSYFGYGSIAVVNGDIDAGYSQPALSGFEWIGTAVHTDIYDLYDALVTQYPNYVSKISLGDDSLGNPVYRYDFTPPPFHSTSQTATQKAIIVSGFHGSEKAGIYCAYSAMKEVCDRWLEDEKLGTLRDHYHFIVVPVCNAYAFDNSTRKNENGVDLERNFPIQWDLGDSDPTSVTYRGPSPLSELQAQYVNTVISENKDALCFASFHNFASSPYDHFIWVAAASNMAVDMGNRLSARQTRKWINDYGLPDPNGYLGYADRTAPVGSAASQASNVNGILASTFEVCDKVLFLGESTRFSGNVATLGTEAFINWLLLNLKYGAELKNNSMRFPG